MATSPLIDFPEDFFRNALDLNRFSNSVAKKLVLSYNRIILDAVSKLDAIERSGKASQPSYRANKLRALLAQVKKSLDTWSEKSSNSVIGDLEGIARLQSDFVVGQLKKALPAGVANSVRSVEISKAFAESVVKSNPLNLNAALLTQDIEAIAKGTQKKFALTSKQGSQIVLPNNKSLRQNFRGLASNQANRFGNVIRDGLLTGETTSEMTRRLAGTLNFNEPSSWEKLSLAQTIKKGGASTRMANSQVSSLVRTTVNQVANEASQSVYKANKDITEKYKWVATLDERTSPQCRLLDGQEFEYGKGPTPPYHFNCRCTTVAVIDYEKQGITPPNLKIGKRAAQGGSVERGTDAADWLKKQSTSVKAKALGGKKKAEYFDYLTTRKKNKLTPKEAIAKMLRGDQTEKSLDDLKRSYGTLPKVKAKPKPKVVKKVVKPKVAPKPKKSKFAQELALLDKQLKEQKDVIAKIEKELEANEKKTKAKLKAIDAKISNIGKPKIKIGKGIDPIHNEYKTKKLEQWEMKEHFYHWSAKLHKSKVGSAASDKALMHMNKLKEAGLKIPGNKFLASNVSDDLKGFMSKKVVKAKDVNEFKKIAKAKETELKKLKSGFKKKTTATTDDYEYIYGRDAMKKMGYKLDSEGFSDEFDDVKNQIQRWKGSSGSFQGVQYERLSKEGKKLSRYGETSRRSFINKTAYQKKLEATQKMEDFISRAPSYKGEISRGLKVDREDFNNFVKDLASGNPSATMESWSAHRSVAANFAEVELMDGDLFYTGFRSEIPVVLRVKNNKYGAPIANVGIGFEDEAEILIPSNVRYRLTDMTKVPVTQEVSSLSPDLDDPVEYFYEIILEQL